MSSASLEPAACEVLPHFGIFPWSSSIRFLGNHGGFSGARLWRVEEPAASWCLRAWPATERLPRRLVEIHRLMRSARQTGLSFVPEIRFTRDKTSWVEHAGRLWDVSQWMPGQADFHNCPTARRLEAALIALASLHNVWSGAHQSQGPCPAVQRRLEKYQEWHDSLRAGWRPTFSSTPDDQVRPVAEQAWQLVRRHLDDVPRMLEPWIACAMPLQPCLCDIWHDHVLFEDQEVAGIIDYGGSKLDHVAVDLARLLGSLVGDSTEQWTTGLGVYRRHRSFSPEEEALAMVLDRTGTLLGAANWLKWLYLEKREFGDRGLVVRRLGTLVERIEKW
ncbi:MAG TPA: aminoglycoside phosphotransferase family protein [Gemmataceae bacterium]|nr:aminoglycoside phosphotransferase family protein [Gemmataceae bacterium]